MAKDYYALLGVKRSASDDEIQRAYRELARKYHPDLNPDDRAAQQKFKDVQQAHDVLSNPEKRRAYDQFGPEFERAGGHPFTGGGGPGGGATFDFEQLFGGAGGMNFGDFFQQMGGGPSPGGGSRRQQRPSKGQDLTAELTVPFNTAVLGGEASISMRRGGKSDAITVKIPPGMESGKKMRLRGQGEEGHGGKPGDLIVEVTVAPHPYFRRRGQNLELTLPVSVGEAMSGATIDIPTPGGTVSLKIPAGSSSGRRLRVKGQGVQNKSSSSGDLFVELQIKLPVAAEAIDELPEEVKQAVSRIESLYLEPIRDNIVW